MINRQTLLSDLQSLLKRLEADLLERSESSAVPEVGKTLRAEYDRAKNAQRTAENYEDWRSAAITQTAAAWVLSCVFVRFLEDNRLIDPPKIAGPNERLQRARDEHELYFRSAPKETDREYLLAAFDMLAKLPGTRDVFGPHNPLRELPNWLSGDAAGELLRFFQKIDANTGALIHDFTDPEWDTRFLGDLYQDLSEAARKKYALLQTPEFVEEFILDRTLEPALDEFGLDAPPVLSKSGNPLTDSGFRMIDPACGSGHFLLGSFRRLLNRWQKREPATNVRELVQRTLASIHGVDVNPYAVAIARFRLLLAAMQTCGVRRLADAPGFTMHLACGDSLLHAPLRASATEAQAVFDFELTSDDSECDHAYQSEDLPALKQMLQAGQYHAVVANPPYITPKDRQLNERYRKRFESCHMKYSLAVPFFERIFRLAAEGGYTGQITANSFMKREFGKKLIESFLPKIDLTHVVDTSGAYIPGHGTPTVILFGRHRSPVASTVRAVMGIRGEPTTPEDPAQGLVWSAILGQIDYPGSQSDFVSVNDSGRERFSSHPWSIGGGGAAELKERLDQSDAKLLTIVDTIGFGAILGEEEIFSDYPNGVRIRLLPKNRRRALVEGDQVRDWSLESRTELLFPYTEQIVICPESEISRWFWPYRTSAWARPDFSRQTYRQCGRTYWEYHQIPVDRNRTPFSIAYAEVATHNHFVFDRGGKVFKQTAPVIKLPPDATEDDHLALLGLLNSSTACFWMKQVCHQKQMMGGDGIRIESKAKVPYAFNATALGKMPIPDAWRSGALRERLLALTQRIDLVSREYDKLSAESVLSLDAVTADTIRQTWATMQGQRREFRATQVFLQEEIDFTVYRMFELVSDELLSPSDTIEEMVVSEGDRPFCIIDGANEEGFNVPTSTPVSLSVGLRNIWDRRISAIKSSRELRLIENSMYKRRWIGRQGLFNHQRSDNELGDAARNWLLCRLESYFDYDGRLNSSGRPTMELEVALTSSAKLADIARADREFMVIGEIFRDDSAFDVERLVEELIRSESVPLLPMLRYKPSGLRKRQAWEGTWELQRREDAIDARTKLPKTDPQYLTEYQARDVKKAEVGDIPVPPKYASADFISTGGARYWSLRGKLDVPKERWVSFPHCEGPDGTLVIAWAGYDHLQLAQAISAWYVEIQERLGGRDDPRLVPLLAGLIELLPWLKQWHNEVDPDYGVPMGDYFEGFLQEEARNLPRPDGGTGWTLDEIKAWAPAKGTRTSRKTRLTKRG